MSYLGRTSTRVPQSRGLRGQVPNRAGGFAWEIDIWERLHRFLVLGSEGGTYYVGQQDLTLDNVEALEACIEEDGPLTVANIEAISTEGRAPKNDPAIFALAYASVKGDDATRACAYAALSRVCRTGTHLFMWAEFREMFGGWSRGSRSAVAAWYLDKEPAQLAYQLVKYRQRGGWTHHDLLHLSHAKPEGIEQDELFNFAKPQEDHDGNVRSWSRRKSKQGPLPDVVRGFKAAQKAKTPRETAGVLERFPQLPWEALNPDHLKDKRVWEQLLANGMPITALVRNLAKLTQIGVLKPMGQHTAGVVNTLTDEDYIKAGKVHPMTLLFALATYESGKSFRGSSAWTPVPEIVDALDDAFHKAFVNVEPTGKRHLIALDCSNSMNYAIMDSMLTCMAGACAMSLVTSAVEDTTYTISFHGHVVPLTITGKERLDHAMRALPRSVGRTDCALPMQYAEEKGLEVDAFVIYSDNETWYGNQHPAPALTKYRKTSGIDAKAVVCAMTGDRFSVADPEDPAMKNVVGFDTTTPAVIADFVRG